MKDYTAKQIQEAISYYRKNASEFGGKERVEEACARWQALAERLDAAEMRKTADSVSRDPLSKPIIRDMINEVETRIKKAAAAGKYAISTRLGGQEYKAPICKYFEDCGFRTKKDPHDYTFTIIYWGDESQLEDLSETEKLDAAEMRKTADKANGN